MHRTGLSTAPRLSQRWRRALVISGSAAAVAIAVLDAAGQTRSVAGFAATLGCGGILLSSFWLLADSVRPWLTDHEVSPEERAHADAALRHAYTTLFTIAMVVMLYLVVADARPSLALNRPAAAGTNLWHFVTLIFLLPVAIAAWTEPRNGFSAGVEGPLGLTRSRFRGDSASVHIVGALATLGLVPLVAAGLARVRGDSPLWADLVVVFWLLLALGIAGTFARQLWSGQSQHRRQL